MKRLKIIPDGVRHAVSETVHIPKSRMKCWLKEKCDALDQRQRFRVVAVAFSVFMLLTLYIFGNACYRMGKGASPRHKIEHITPLDISSGNVKPAPTAPVYEP